MKKVETFFHQETSTCNYVVFDPETKDAVVIDPVLDFDLSSGAYWHDSINQIIDFSHKENLNLHYAIDTHVHADHITGTFALKQKVANLKSVIGQSITQAQEVFFKLYNLPHHPKDGSQFDLLVVDNQVFEAGSLKIHCIHTPGHTPTCTSYLIDDMLFCGDALFMPDFGTGRCDFPQGSANQLYHSIYKKLYQLPDETRVFVGHDYQPGGRKLQWETTIKESKEKNIHLKFETTENDFVSFRQSRDKKLNTPKLLLPSIQVNANGGMLPTKENNGSIYLKIPMLQKENT